MTSNTNKPELLNEDKKALTEFGISLLHLKIPVCKTGHATTIARGIKSQLIELSEQIRKEAGILKK